MKIVRFLSGQNVHYGKLISPDAAHLIDGNFPHHWHVTREEVRVDKLLAPIIPTDILCIGVNYHDHAAESGIAVPDHPLLFIKSGNTLNNPNDPILIPKITTQIDYEGELAIVISKAAKNVPPENAAEYILGYTVANDVTARDWQRDKKLGGGQFARGKSFDTFLPLGPWIVTADEIPNPNNLQLTTKINGKTLQNANTSQMIFQIPALIASLSLTMTLRPGALILTGTPAGVGMGRTPPLYLQPNDKVTIEIESIGKLENPVSQE